MEVARKNPDTHTPSTFDAFTYFVRGVKPPKGDEFDVEH